MADLSKQGQRFERSIVLARPSRERASRQAPWHTRDGVADLMRHFRGDSALVRLAALFLWKLPHILSAAGVVVVLALRFLGKL